MFQSLFDNEVASQALIYKYFQGLW